MEATVNQLRIYITLAYGILAAVTVLILCYEIRRAGR